MFCFNQYLRFVKDWPGLSVILHNRREENLCSSFVCDNTIHTEILFFKTWQIFFTRLQRGPNGWFWFKRVCGVLIFHTQIFVTFQLTISETQRHVLSCYQSEEVKIINFPKTTMLCCCAIGAFLIWWYYNFSNFLSSMECSSGDYVEGTSMSDSSAVVLASCSQTSMDDYHQVRLTESLLSKLVYL